jgi:glycosyltransferase involved in cell wall biosynthesis
MGPQARQGSGAPPHVRGQPTAERLEPTPEPSPAPSLVSVVVPVRNGGSALGEQLAALAAQTYDGPWELIVADNGSTDHTSEIIREWLPRFPRARAVDASARPSPGFARNVGTWASHGELVLYTDADDVVDPGWIAAMAEAAREHPFVAGCDTFEPPAPDGVPTHAAPASPARVPFLPWTRGGNMGVHRTVFDEVGGWSEDWPRGQDVEFAWRVQVAGYPLHVVEDARVWYRRPTATWPLVVHQYRLGLHGPALYREFRSHGAPTWSPRRAWRTATWLVTRSPLLLSRTRRRSWLLVAAGSLGRAVGTVRCLRRDAVDRREG